MFDQIWFGTYVLLSCLDCIFIVWVMQLISHDRFLGTSGEPLALRNLRRASLVMIAAGIVLSVNWHVHTQRSPWPPEMLVAAGLALYFSLAICGTYVRLRRSGRMRAQ